MLPRWLRSPELPEGPYIEGGCGTWPRLEACPGFRNDGFLGGGCT